MKRAPQPPPCVTESYVTGVMNPDIRSRYKRLSEALMKMRKYDLSGQRRRTVRGEDCIYCGEWATCRDHFPPVSMSKVGVLLPSCHECNFLAGVHHPTDLVSRIRHVRQAIEKKYRRVLETPEWSDEELSELGRGLKEDITKWRNLRRTVLRRIVWNAESYLKNIDPTSYSALISAGFDAIEGIKREKYWHYDASFVL